MIKCEDCKNSAIHFFRIDSCTLGVMQMKGFYFARCELHTVKAYEYVVSISMEEFVAGEILES